MGERGGNFPRNVTLQPPLSLLLFSLSLHLLLFSIPPFTLYRFILSPISLSSFPHSTPPLNPFFSPLCSDSPAISSPHAGKVEPLPERLITFLPPAVYTPVRGSHTDSLPPVEQSGTYLSTVSHCLVFSVNPQLWQSMAAQHDPLAINQKEDMVQRFSSKSSNRNHLFWFVLVGSCLQCEDLNSDTLGNSTDVLISSYRWFVWLL